MTSPAVLDSTAPLFLLGATGTGKSAAAMELARQTGAAILALDAMQVYRGADIGTSKPSAAERAEVPHGGLDLVDFGAEFNLAHYLKHAEAFLREQNEAGRRVLIVGGTGLYFRALTRGLCEAPPGPEALRAELNALPVEALQERLRQVDPEMVPHLDIANPRRLIRAIEVMESTGRSLRDWQAATPEPLVRDFKAVWIQRGKGELEIRISDRVKAMFAAGWVEEVRGLMETYGAETVRKFPGIGYRDIVEFLVEGRYSEVAAAVPGGGACALNNLQAPPPGTAAATSDLQRHIHVATRQYAKRQLTWFHREPSLISIMLSGHQPLSPLL